MPEVYLYTFVLILKRVMNQNGRTGLEEISFFNDISLNKL